MACNSSGCSCHTYAYYGGRGGRPIPLSRVAIHNICLVWWPLWLANRLAFGVRGGHTYAQHGGHGGNMYAQCGGRDSAACVQCGGLRRQLFICASSWFPAQTAGFQADSWFPMQYALCTIQTAGDLRRQLDITRTAGFLCRQLVIYVDSCCLMQAAGFFMQKAAYLRR